MKVKMRVIRSPNIKMRIGEAIPIKVIEDVYEGSYTIVPKIEAQTMETAEKYMLEDVTIKAIPYYETDNQIGTTVYIGNEVEIYGN